MKMEQLDKLEERINQAVGLIEQLKAENSELQNEISRIEADCDAKEKAVQQLKEENQNLRLLQAESSLGKEKEEKIRSKIEQMLTKLDELQSL